MPDSPTATATASSTDRFTPGARVRITQQIAQRQTAWTIDVTGTIVRFAQRKTGSWFAHAKDDKLWLDRLLVRKDDGELVEFNLDEYTRVEFLPAPPNPAAAAPPTPHSGGDTAGDEARSVGKGKEAV